MGARRHPLNVTREIGPSGRVENLRLLPPAGGLDGSSCGFLSGGLGEFPGDVAFCALEERLDITSGSGVQLDPAPGFTEERSTYSTWTPAPRWVAGLPTSRLNPGLSGRVSTRSRLPKVRAVLPYASGATGIVRNFARFRPDRTSLHLLGDGGWVAKRSLGVVARRARGLDRVHCTLSPECCRLPPSLLGWVQSFLAGSAIQTVGRLAAEGFSGAPPGVPAAPTDAAATPESVIVMVIVITRPPFPLRWIQPWTAPLTMAAHVGLHRPRQGVRC